MTKTALTNKCKAIWLSYRLNDKISDDDCIWLIENVFSNHPEWEWWSRQGISSISTSMGLYGKPCFRIHFTYPENPDESSSIISWTKSINNK